MIRQGEVYWLSDCPPLEGEFDKDRPVIVLSTPQELKAGHEEILVVACSTTVFESERDRIRLPTAADTPHCRSGLTRPSWAVPRWYLLVSRDRLQRPVGHIRRPLLATIIPAVLARMAG